jgi:mRNA-degrading endonuclease toxin of MazEF toxin-antitoxin module
VPTPSYGRIVWVEINDPQGRSPKGRPAVIISKDDTITPEGDVWVVGVSTQLDAAPPETQVELQYDPRGVSRTQLREKCAAVCTWVLKVPVASIQSYAGIVPGRQMIAIAAKLGELGSGPP